MDTIMKFTFALIIFSFASLSAFSQFQESDVAGLWYFPDEEGICEIFEKNGKYYGKIAWQSEPYDRFGMIKTDFKNPDPKRHKKVLTGLTFMYGFKFNGKDKWDDGIVYNVLNGKNYKAHIKVKGENKDILELRGFLGVSMIGQTSTWTRVTGLSKSELEKKFRQEEELYQELEAKGK